MAGFRIVGFARATSVGSFGGQVRRLLCREAVKNAGVPLHLVANGWPPRLGGYGRIYGVKVMILEEITPDQTTLVSVPLTLSQPEP